MKYINFSEFNDLIWKLKDYADWQTESGHEDTVLKIAEGAKKSLENALKAIADLKLDPEIAKREPNDYDEIQKLIEGGNTAVSDIDNFKKRMEGALIGRFAGCTLGVPVENQGVEVMKKIAKYANTDFPPTDYWTMCNWPWDLQYEQDERSLYLRDNINGVPVDDDITYTLLGLLILEKYGPDFTTEDVGKMWVDLLPVAWTAEKVAIENLKKGIPASKAGETDNPYMQWIGADIRSDGFAYACAGDPHKAAWMGYKDAYLSHRRNGIYGEMFFCAAIAAAFCVDDPIDAIKIGLKEIPKECALYKDIEWALSVGDKIKDHAEAKALVDERFNGMNNVHTNNNACLVVFALMLNKNDFNKAISDVVAMGYDNDCTGATVGSIMGAIYGIDAISPHWYKNFNNTVRSYMRGYPEFKIDELVERYIKMRGRICE